LLIAGSGQTATANRPGRSELRLAGAAIAVVNVNHAFAPRGGAAPRPEVILRGRWSAAQ